MAEDVDHMPCRSGRPMVFIKPHDDIVTATTMPKMQVRPPSHEQLVVFHFSSDVLGSSGVVSLCEPRKNHQKIATPSGQSLFRRLVADCRGLSTRCVLPRRTRNTAGHEQQKDTLRSREQKFRESVTGHAFIFRKKNEIAWKVLSWDLCLARWKLCYTSLSSFLSGSKQTISVPLPTDPMIVLLAGGAYVEP